MRHSTSPNSPIQIARTGLVPQTPGSQRGTCKNKCPGGYMCNCNQFGNHQLHICQNPGCWCHSQDRYEGRRYGTTTNRR